jgi:hypothetical protein
MDIHHHRDAHPSLGNAGLRAVDRRNGYCATLCFVSESGEFIDVHLTAEHLRHLARLVADRGDRFVDGCHGEIDP